MHRRYAILVVLAVIAAVGRPALAPAPALADDGLVSVRSAHGVAETLDRLEQAAREAGAVIAARIDHSANAAKVGQTLRPTALLLFANPKAGTPLLQARQTMGIDLPLKALAWQDERGQVWLTYNALPYLAARHKLAADTVEPMRQGLERLIERATRP
jgi:uncharacterized protein (DUF302 family)